MLLLQAQGVDIRQDSSGAASSSKQPTAQQQQQPEEALECIIQVLESKPIVSSWLVPCAQQQWHAVGVGQAVMKWHLQAPSRLREPTLLAAAAAAAGCIAQLVSATPLGWWVC
jgi:hypothetical protein